MFLKLLCGFPGKKTIVWFYYNGLNLSLKRFFYEIKIKDKKYKSLIAFFILQVQ